MSGTNKTVADYYGSLKTEREKVKDEDLSEIERAYGVGLGDLQKNRVQQRQEAAINNELLMKYLPQLNKASGLTGLGVAQSANVDALSRYQTNLGNIEDTYQRGKTSLDETRESSIRDVNRAYETDIAKIYADERTEMVEKEDRIRENALMYIESGVFETEEELNAFVDGLSVSDETKAEIKSLGMAQVKKIEDQTELEKGKLGADTDAAGNKIVAAYSKGDASNKFDFVGDANARANLDAAGTTFFVSVGDKDIPVSSGGLVPSETIPETVRSYTENDKVFMYDGVIYIKKNSSIYQVAPAGDGYDPEYNRAYNELKSYLNGGAAPTVDASPEYTKPAEGTTSGKESSTDSVEVNGTKALRAKFTGVADNVIVDYNGEKYFKSGTKYYKIVNND